MKAANEPLPWGEVRHGFTALRKIYYRIARGAYRPAAGVLEVTSVPLDAAASLGKLRFSYERAIHHRRGDPAGI